MDVKKLEQAKQWVEKELASSAEFWLDASRTDSSPSAPRSMRARS